MDDDGQPQTEVPDFSEQFFRVRLLLSAVFGLPTIRNQQVTGSSPVVGSTNP
jgi:hypothetical protein